MHGVSIVTLTNAIEVRNQFASDFHRPRYHYLPPSNWMNDPNGLVQWKGKYHLFYQHNPHGPLWGNIGWGHAVSTDMIRWVDLPLALEPTKGTYDEGGCFSGCLVDDQGVPTIFYTAAHGEHSSTQVQCMATGDDDLIEWRKHPNNPILGQIPPEMAQTEDFRDPFVWREDGMWYMVLGSRVADDGGAVLLYRSKDLLHWEYLNPLLTAEDNRFGAVWECPNFFRIADKWVLIVSAHTASTTDTVFYFVGEYENHRFRPFYSDILDYGNLYAPLTFEDDHNHRILFGWVREARSEVDQRLAGWSGVQSIPRVLTLDDYNRLTMTPVAALDSVRGKHYTVDTMPIEHDIHLEITGLHLDIVARFKLAPNGYCGLSLACSPDNREHISIMYEQDRQRLCVRKVNLETNDVLTTHIRDVPHRLATGDRLQLRIMVDGSGTTPLSRILMLSNKVRLL